MKKYLLKLMLITITVFMAACQSNNSDNGETNEVAQDIATGATGSFPNIDTTSSLNIDPSQTQNTYLRDGMSPEASFAIAATEIGMLEVEAGTLAQRKSSSQRVKEFGQIMVKDHAEANMALRTIAQGKGIELPANLRAELLQKFNHLQTLDGPQFDRAYSQLMVDSHKMAIGMFMDYTDRTGERNNVAGADADHEVQNWALKQKPILQLHLEAAQRLLAAETTNTAGAIRQ